jgi:hypothetical protein
MEMSVAIARIFPHASAASVADIETFVGGGIVQWRRPIAVIVRLDPRSIPGEWF